MLSTVLSGAAVLTAALIAPAPAQADVEAQLLDTLTCASSSTTTYDPPIGLTPVTTTRTIHQVYGPCVGTGVASAVTGGTHDSSNTTARSCLQLLSTATVSWTIHWSNGSQSTVTTQRVSNLAGAVFTNTFTGTVTSGLLTGHAVVETMTAPSTQILACTLGQGTVSSLGAVHTLTIV
ncbi:hypothetical protein [Phytomonospora endophytica]|uniref:Ig-like domain-containing protein n=1 Tax=Phytomonospora endophytica TaxID=714109 RepID=A0A841FQK4_9ACTN|nr:hypothetical protein [Phytomonospora endophytica]MBB6039571.1 hypothetical protein [Phytomonospora endophytica]GIG70537.1 hypothetical protein Pen01_68320 [Phytomonospora endophytica]